MDKHVIITERRPKKRNIVIAQAPIAHTPLPIEPARVTVQEQEPARVTVQEQAHYVNKLYCNIPFDGDKMVSGSILKKLSGYKQQDMKKKRYNEERTITYAETIEKLVESKLRCYYCKCTIVIIYEEIRQKNQWTLERINNAIGHYMDNVVIACLDCNLKRGCSNSSYFKSGKDIRTIIKLE
jgi:hypothetical protein